MDSEPLNFVTHGTARAIPIEDIKPGDVLHTSQLQPTPEANVERVRELALTGLTQKGIAALCKIDELSLLFHFKRTLAEAKATSSSELLQRLRGKAFDETFKGDLKAISILLNRLDPEPKPTVITVSTPVHVDLQLGNLSPAELNHLSWQEALPPPEEPDEPR